MRGFSSPPVPGADGADGADGATGSTGPVGPAFAYGNTASRPATPADKDLYYNTQTNALEQWNGSAWQDRQVQPRAHAAAHLPGGTDELAWSATIHQSGTLAARPVAAASNAGCLYWVSDTKVLFRSSGSAWTALAPAQDLAAGITAISAASDVDTAGAGLGHQLVYSTATSKYESQSLDTGFVVAGGYLVTAYANGTVTNDNSTEGQLTVTPVVVSRRQTFDRIGFYVRAAGSAGSVFRLGIYSGDGAGEPVTLVLDAGTVLADTFGLKEITISQTLSAGRYWLAVVLQGGASTKPGISRMGAGLTAAPILGDPLTSISPSVPLGHLTVGGAVAGALPNPWPASSPGAPLYRIGLRGT